MFGKMIKMICMGTVAAALLAGCSGGIRGPQVFAGFNGDPHCAPGPKPCPREYPEFPLPPGGPYLETPAYARQSAPAPAPYSNAGQEKLTIAK